MAGGGPPTQAAHLPHLRLEGLAEGVVDEGVVDSGGLGEQAGQHAHQWWDGGAVLVH